MNETLASFFLTVAGAIIMLLLGGIMYFLKKWIDSTDALTCSVNDLKTTVALLQSNQGNNDRNCTKRHEVIDRRLNDHSEKIHEHSEAIVEIQSRISQKRKSYRQGTALSQ